MKENMFQLCKIYCKHPSNAQFQRLLAFVTDHNENPHHLCLVSYSITAGLMPSVTPHYNSKSKKLFYPSTKLKIQSKSNFHAPKSTLNSISNDMGGVIGAKSPCDLPRNEHQVCYIKKKSSIAAEQPDKPPDEILALLLRAKSEDDGGKFVQETKVSPEPAFVVAQEWQLDDLLRFCTPAEEFSILTIDPTFNLVEFYVTPTNYLQVWLLAKCSYWEVASFYRPYYDLLLQNIPHLHFLASTLVGLRPGLQGLRGFGTDDEKALMDAFSHEFSYALHLTCFNHCQQNIKRKLHQYNYLKRQVRNAR